MTRIAYLGPEGTVSHEATAHFFPEQEHILVPYRWISDVCLATVHQDTDISVIPIENTIDGSVNPHIDFLIHEIDLPIQAEWIYPSVQNLIGYHSSTNKASDIDLSTIHTIVSIPVAIAQCQQFLKNHLPGVTFEHVSSTAEGVRIVKERQDPGYAAIGTATAAQMYELDVLAANITDHENNYTRFIAVGHHSLTLPRTNLQKTTILVTLPEDYPGALHQVLSAFAWRRINLTKIESRPTKKNLGSYFFYIDIEGSLQSLLLPNAISEIESIGCQVRILGSYPIYSYQTIISEV
ncbi:MAG: prephenate dehydratase [Paenibacillaceae bacterium]